MFGRQPEALRGLARRIELNEHRGFPSDDPSVVTRLDHDNGRRREVERAAVTVLTLDSSRGQETDVAEHAQVGANDWFHVGRPAKSRRIDDALDLAIGGGHRVNHHTADLVVLGALDRPASTDRLPKGARLGRRRPPAARRRDRKSTRLNSSHVRISYAVFCLKKKKNPLCRIVFLKKKKNNRIY